MRIYGSSAGLDVARLVPGQDLVLRVDESHGVDLPHGVAALDHLDLDARRRADAVAHRTLMQWRAQYDEAWTIDGICWPFVWEWQLFRFVFVPAVMIAMAVRAALDTHRPPSLEWCDRDQVWADVCETVAMSCGITTGIEGGQREIAWRPPPRQMPLTRRIRRTLFDLLTSAELPTRLRPGSVLVMSYWPMMPLLDRMFTDRRWQPAIFSDRRPVGIARSLRAAAQGGWIGRPGRRSLAKVGARMEERIAATSVSQPRIEVDGMALGSALHRRCIEYARQHGAEDLAMSAIFRRAVEAHPPRALLVPYDHNPRARLCVWLAKQADVPTVVIQHGAYVIPTELNDMTVADVAAIWSPAVAPPVEFARPPWSIGYPLPHHPPPPTRTRHGRAAPRVLLMAQTWETGSALIDPRDVMRHYVAGIGAIRSVLPGASITLRPHPSGNLAPAYEVSRRVSQIGVDVRSSFAELLGECDLCIGAPSSGALEAALVGTPLVLLNVTGHDWRWPLGGETTVPVARSEDQLAGWLRRWAQGEVLPGREALLEGLGAGEGDATERLLTGLAGLNGSGPGDPGERWFSGSPAVA